MVKGSEKMRARLAHVGMRAGRVGVVLLHRPCSALQTFGPEIAKLGSVPVFHLRAELPRACVVNGTH